jgi:hypothetical protein
MVSGEIIALEVEISVAHRNPSGDCEPPMRRHRQEDIEIARRRAAQARPAFAGQPDAGAVLNAGRDI